MKNPAAFLMLPAFQNTQNWQRLRLAGRLSIACELGSFAELTGGTVPGSRIHLCQAQHQAALNTRGFALHDPPESSDGARRVVLLQQLVDSSLPILGGRGRLPVCGSRLAKPGRHILDQISLRKLIGILGLLPQRKFNPHILSAAPKSTVSRASE